MKRSVKKFFLSILACTAIISSASPVMAGKITANLPYSIYESKESKYIASGVRHESIQKFSYLGWWNINVLRVDLKDEYTELKGLINPDGVPNRNRVSTLVDKHDALAGINGDYFNYAPLPSAMGTLINEGEVISSPIEKGYELPTFYLTDNNEGIVDYVDRDMTVTNLRTNERVVINTINKATPEFDTVGLLNKHWGTKSIGNRFHNDLIEIVVEDGVVIDFRVGKEPVDIPTNEGYILSIRGKNRARLENFQIGDKIDLKIATTPDVDSIKFAIGGGSIILRNGELALTDIQSPGNQPRTGIGVNKDNTELILVTIDGRGNSFKGVGLPMFGAIMRNLGAHNALNLDGGGSTTMAIKPKGESNSKVVNTPSEGSERAVVNAVGLISNAPKGELSYIKVLTDEYKMFKNTSRSFSIKGYDQYHNPIEVDNSITSFSVTGVEGEVNNNKFTASTSGTAVVTANYNGIEASADVRVLGEVVDISTNITRISMDTNSEYRLPSFIGKDSDGNEAKIINEDINFHLVGNIGEIKSGILYSGDMVQSGALTAEIGKGIKNILVSVGSTGKVVDSFESIEDYNFSVYPRDIVSGSISHSSDAKDGNHSIALNYDFSQGENTRVAYLNIYRNGKLGLQLEDSPNKLGLWVNGDSSGGWLRAAIKDSKGKEHLTDLSKTVDWTGWEYIEANIPEGVSYPITIERIYIAEIDSSKKQSGTILIDGLTSYYTPSISNLELPTSSTFSDKKNIISKVEEDGFSVGVSNVPGNLNELLEYNASDTIRKALGRSKIAVLLNGSNDDFKSTLTNYSYIDTSTLYRTNKHGDLLFISLDSSKGGIRATNADQWMSLNRDLKSRRESNIILFLPTPIFGSKGFVDQMEADLLHKTLVEARRNGKNIFVVHGGSNTNSSLKEGIRYIELNTSKLNSSEDIYNLSTVQFIVNKDNMTYQIHPLFIK